MNAFIGTVLGRGRPLTNYAVGLREVGTMWVCLYVAMATNIVSAVKPCTRHAMHLGIHCFINSILVFFPNIYNMLLPVLVQNTY